MVGTRLNVDTPLHYDGLMVSYAQFGEDVMLRRFFDNQTTGFFIDVGAGDPVIDSVTLHFSLSGWTGINVEPLPDAYQQLLRARPKDINLNVALSSRSATLEFAVNHNAPGLSTTTADLIQEYERQGHHLERIRVPACTLADVVREHCPARKVDFLKLDAEGHEAEIIRGADLSAWRPRVIVIEAGYRPEAWDAMVLQAGYILGGTDPVNRYYVREDEAPRAAALSCPANVGDHYVCWRDVQARRVTAEWNAMGPAIRNVVRFLQATKGASPTAKRLAKRAVHFIAPGLLRDR